MFEKIIKKLFKTECQAEFRFHPKRRWRADYVLPKYKILIEVEGAVWTQGRHTRGSGFVKDMEKYNTATSMGYSILRVQPKDLTSTTFLDLVKTTIDSKK